MPAQTPNSPAFSDGSFDFSNSTKRRAKIDYSKYKTKICRHYQLGSCPFEDRCAFSHGDDASPEMSPEASPRHPRRVKSESTMISDEHDSPSDNTSNCEVYVPPPPPAYEVAVMEEMRMSEYTMMPATAYPSRYRYDPYSYSGIRVESDY
eukprot:gene5966-4275_t